MSLLELTDLTVTRRGAPVLGPVSLRIGAGTVVGLLGPNGAGKTTLMRAALGLIPATGSIRLGGTDHTTLDPMARARAVAHVPQDREIAWPITVANLVGLGRLPHPEASEPDNARAIEAALEMMDLASLKHRPATELSGGERARALIARALAQDAPLLIADEPTAGLDPSHALTLMARLRRMARLGRGVLVSLHDLGLAARWCDRIVLMEAGRIVADGTPAEVLTPARLETVYGIRAHIAADADGPILVPTGLAGT